MIQVSAGQSLLDVCLQELGDVAALFDLADANGLAITDTVEPGRRLLVPESLLGQAQVVAYFGSREQRINTNNRPAVTAALPAPESSFFHPDYFNSAYYG